MIIFCISLSFIPANLDTNEKVIFFQQLVHFFWELLIWAMLAHITRINDENLLYIWRNYCLNHSLIWVVLWIWELIQSYNADHIRDLQRVEANWTYSGLGSILETLYCVYYYFFSSDTSTLWKAKTAKRSVQDMEVDVDVTDSLANNSSMESNGTEFYVDNMDYYIDEGEEESSDIYIEYIVCGSVLVVGCVIAAILKLVLYYIDYKESQPVKTKMSTEEEYSYAAYAARDVMSTQGYNKRRRKKPQLGATSRKHQQNKRKRLAREERDDRRQFKQKIKDQNAKRRREEA